MLSILILCSASTVSVAQPSWRNALEPIVRVAQLDADYERRRKEAGDDLKKLWDLHSWCVEQKKDKEARATLRQIIKVEPNNQHANELLGYVQVDGKWFPSQKKADEYKRAQEDKQAQAQGLVDYKGKKVPAADVPFLEKGLVKDDSGKWVNADLQKKLKEGWVQQDLEWVSPQEKPEMEKGLWKCGDKWLSLDDADKYHADLEQWWRIPTPHFTLYTTCDRAVALDSAKKHMELAYADATRAYGAEPKSPVIVVVLRDAKQYSNFAAGDKDAQRPPSESRGLSSIHYAYFADLGFDPADGEFMGAGVAYWDASTDAGNRFGVHAVRRALAESFAEALDPSPQATAKLKKALKTADVEAFFEEKRLPQWYRHGVSTYVERYYIDKNVAAGENPNWARNWSVGSIASRGGLRPLKQVFDTEVTVEGADDSAKLLNELGLVIAFALDGGCAPVSEKNAAVQKALATSKDAKPVEEAVAALQAAVIEHEGELRKFAGL